jgi:hypothetical protein
MTEGASVALTPASNSPNYGPPQVMVNGSAFTYQPASSGANNGSGADVYAGSFGQTLYINPDGTVSLNQADGTVITGTFNPTTAQFNLTSGSGTVVTATAGDVQNSGTPGGGFSGTGTGTELAGTLDIAGNSLTLGSWSNGSTNGFSLLYADQGPVNPPNLPSSLASLNFSSTRALIDWNWSHPNTDAGSTQVPAMQLDSMHRVKVFDPATPGTARVILDPGTAGSIFHGPLRVQPQGDISMGGYTAIPTGGTAP